MVGSDKAKNVAAAVSEIHKAKENGAHIVALPECFNSPYGTSKYLNYMQFFIVVTFVMLELKLKFVFMALTLNFVVSDELNSGSEY